MGGQAAAHGAEINGDDDGAALVAIIREAASEAAAFVRERERDRGALRWESKLPSDFVSEVDVGAERIISERLASAYPHAVLVGEELSPLGATDAAISFVIDPLDGTTNFLHGYPEYAVSIAAVRHGNVVAGVVRHIVTGEEFTAIAGHGALLDGSPIRVSAERDVSRALIGTGVPFKHPGQIDVYLPQLRVVAQAASGVRRAGSAALDLCDVACGRFEAFWELTLAPWDFAAAMLIVREAGGVVTDLGNAPPHLSPSAIVAGSPLMHAWLLRTLDAAGAE